MTHKDRLTIIQSLDPKGASNLRLSRVRRVAHFVLVELKAWRQRRERPDVDVICAIKDFSKEIEKLDVEIATRAVDAMLRDNALLSAEVSHG